MLEEMAYIRFGPLCVPFIKTEELLQLCSNNSEIVDWMSLLPGALEVDGVNSLVLEDVICGMGIVVDHAASAPIQPCQRLARRCWP